MPVTLLLCEGGPNSPDVRVLGKLLQGLCEVRPCGSRYSMGERILARREAVGDSTVYGLIDGDFPANWDQHDADNPKRWETAGGIHLGWRWARKEIENYLVDPQVARRGLGDAGQDAQAYEQALYAARDRIADYQAARTALAVSRPRFQVLPSSFGRPRGRDKHPFPDALNEDICRKAICRAVEDYLQSQLVDPGTVEQRFEALLPEMRPGGVRYCEFIAAFAGKDLLWAIDDDLRKIGFGGASVFREKVLLGIARAVDDVADWLTEWKRLREIVEKTE